MKDWESYTDKDNMDFAKSEYEDFNTGEAYYVGKGNERRTAGYVQEKYGFDEKGNNDTSHEGMQAYVVTPENNQDPKDVKEVAVVYQGSNTPGSADGNVDWFVDDLPVGVMIEVARMPKGQLPRAVADVGVKVGGTIPPQFEESAETLDKVCEKYPNAQVRVYGHSLASMDGQYAVSATKYPERIQSAYLYQGPNIYPILPDEQKEQASTMRDRVYNYQDSKDFVSIGYSSFGNNTVGQLIHVDGNKDSNTTNQHMWGGYDFTKDGKLKTQSDFDNFLETPINLTIRGVNAVVSVGEFVESLATKGIDAVSDFVSDAVSEGSKIKIEPAGVIGLAASMVAYVDKGLEEIKSDLEKKKQEFEDDWEATLNASMDIGRDLSSQEVRDALAEVGVTHKTMVTDPQDVLENLKKEVEERQESLTQFADKIKQAATQFEAGDEEVASLWN